MWNVESGKWNFYKLKIENGKWKIAEAASRLGFLVGCSKAKAYCISPIYHFNIATFRFHRAAETQTIVTQKPYYKTTRRRRVPQLHTPHSTLHTKRAKRALQFHFPLSTFHIKKTIPH